MLLAVWDGHGGKDVAELAKKLFKDLFIESKEFKEQNYKEALI